MIFTTNNTLEAWGTVLENPDLAEGIIGRVPERGRGISLAGPFMRTRHIKPEDLDPRSASEPAQVQPARIFGKLPPAFSEPAPRLSEFGRTAGVSLLFEPSFSAGGRRIMRGGALPCGGSRRAASHPLLSGISG